MLEHLLIRALAGMVLFFIIGFMAGVLIGASIQAGSLRSCVNQSFDDF